jgi:hypothetical protein
MRIDRIDQAGFAPHNRTRVRGRHRMMVAQLITTAALVLSIAVAATVVSIGIAHAEGIATGAEDQNARIAAAIVLAFLLVGIGGVTAFIGRRRLLVKPGE